VNFPAGSIEKIAQAGALAPSGDNLQPWNFINDDGALLIFHDPNQDRSLFNVRHLASYIALGAVLENVLIAATKYNYRANISYFPDPQKQNLIARVTFTSGAEADLLADSIEKRCTNRRPYKTSTLDSLIIQRLNLEPNRFPRIGLIWLSDRSSLKKIGAIVSRADRLLFENPLIHGHLFSTLRWNQAEIERTRDGLPIASLELGRVGSIAFRTLKNWNIVKCLNRFGLSKAVANHSTLLMKRCSAAGLITAPDVSPSSFLEVGHSFQRVWLSATKENLAFQPMTAIIFLQLRSRLGDYEGLAAQQINVVDELRWDLQRFFALSKDTVPAMLFRIGYAIAPSAKTIRRSVSETLKQRTCSGYF
jgi:sulfur-carrier protein adenylyltransferase/sulfurtransferase